MATNIPLFPLGTVLLPGNGLPLHIFEPRYRQLVSDLMCDKWPDKEFGVVAMRPGWSPRHGADSEAIFDYGCTATVHEVNRLPDGRFDIMTTGKRRFAIEDIHSSTEPYFTASVRWVADLAPPQRITAAIPSLARAARIAHHRYCSSAWQGGDWSEPDSGARVEQLAHQLAADCLLSLEDKQTLLETRCPARRLDLVRELLVREGGFLRQLRAIPMPLTEFSQENGRN